MRAVLFDGDVTDVFGANPYHTRAASFMATDISMELTFAQTAAGDNTVLLDDIKVSGETRPPLPCLGVARRPLPNWLRPDDHDCGHGSRRTHRHGDGHRDVSQSQSGGG